MRAEVEMALSECWRQAVRWESGPSRVMLSFALERIPAAAADDEDEGDEASASSAPGADSGYSIL